jgi:hypothetical protein
LVLDFKAVMGRFIDLPKDVLWLIFRVDVVNILRRDSVVSRLTLQSYFAEFEVGGLYPTPFRSFPDLIKLAMINRTFHRKP